MMDCPTCGKSFDGNRGVKSHHRQSHSISLKEFEEDREWVREEMSDESISNLNLDRMMKHLEQTIQLNEEKFDL